MSKHTDQPLSDDADNPLLNPNSNPNPILADENDISNNSSAYGDYITYNIDGYTATQRKELKEHLTSNLEKVRSLQQRMESGEFVGGPVDVGDKKTKMNNSFAANEQGLKNPCVEKMCGEILEKLMEQKWSDEIFGRPVDALALGIYNYHTIISKPMDLGTVKTKLENGGYSSPIEFAKDVRLTFTNAMAYNPKGHYVHVLAEKLLGQFDNWFKPALTKQIPTDKKLDSVKPLPKLPPLVLKLTRVPSTPPVSKVGAPLEGTKERKGKPKAKDPNKRAMKKREKETLAKKLEELPLEKLGEMIQILRKSGIDLKQDGDENEKDMEALVEIGIDLEALDIETLWELDRFVINYEHKVNKIKRQERIQKVSTPRRDVPVVTEMGSAEKKESKGEDAEEEEEEEDVDIGVETPIDSHPSVDIEKDDPSGEANSSGSSSSNGSSSSSDSESGSSSGSDSEAPSDKIGGET